MLFTYLVSGETEEVPFDWFGDVQTVTFGDDEPVIFMMASRMSDPKEMVDKFRKEYNRLYGKDRPKITKGFLNAADQLRMYYEGKPIRDIADAYILKHRSQFPKDAKSNEYKAAKKKLEERLKKRNQRYKKLFLKLLGDKN
jgi:hypothetical protein